MSISEIERDELQQLIEQGDVTLVEALPEEVHAVAHLPKALCIRPRRVDELAPVLLPDFEAPIVVYCNDKTCDSSHRVAERLSQLGYRSLYRYKAGKLDWIAAGLPVEGNAVEAKKTPCC